MTDQQTLKQDQPALCKIIFNFFLLRWEISLHIYQVKIIVQYKITVIDEVFDI